ncbi:response regulator [Methanoregula sp.]|jgi:CheY-like chemotaxis protein|uniref:response regulator n=1 Tax=Methanoregula sp. TaxID=2052170 RepID=UPI003C29A3AA
MTRILIIDDSSFQRRIVTGILKDAGYDVSVADNGRDGIELAQKDAPSLIITDLLMPEYDGFYLLKEARAQDLGIPVLVLTSDIQDTTREQCYNLGAAGLVNKPVKKEVLLPAITRVLSGERP